MTEEKGKLYYTNKGGLICGVVLLITLIISIFQPVLFTCFIGWCSKWLTSLMGLLVIIIIGAPVLGIIIDIIRAIKSKNENKK